MKAAVIGTGGIAQTHAEALRMAGISIAAAVDVNADAARTYAEKWGVPVWGTDPALLYSPEIDCVHVCTPPNLHFELVRSLLEAGKHVLCEKPLCFDTQEAAALNRLAREKRIACAINLNVRFHIACQKAKQIISDPSFGRILLVHGSYLQEYHAFPAPDGWRYDEALAGKMRAVTEIGTHWMDIAQYLSGKRVTEVSAQFGCFHPIRYEKDGMMYAGNPDESRRAKEVHSEDAALIQFRMEDGAIGSVVLSEVSPGHNNRLSLEITGENRNLWWNSEENNLLCTGVKGGGVNQEIFAFGNGFADTFRALVQQFYADIRSGAYTERPVYPTFEDGANIVAVCNAIYESATHNSVWTSTESIS